MHDLEKENNQLEFDKQTAQASESRKDRRMKEVQLVLFKGIIL